MTDLAPFAGIQTASGPTSIVAQLTCLPGFRDMTRVFRQVAASL